MRYAVEHKQRTRARIVRAAGRVFRRRGLNEAGVAEVMRAAGLTHGGFYAHFRSKATLTAAVFAEAHHALQALRKAVEEWKAAGRAHPLVRIYLSRWHCEHRDVGCLLPALAGDLTRAPRAVQRAFSQALPGYVAEISAMAFDGRRDDPRAVPLIAALAGALLLARAVGDPAESDRILRACRRTILATFFPENPPP